MTHKEQVRQELYKLTSEIQELSRIYLDKKDQQDVDEKIHEIAETFELGGTYA